MRSDLTAGAPERQRWVQSLREWVSLRGGLTNGNDCFLAFSCCKFNCNFVGQGASCDDANECTSATVCDQYGQCANGLNVLEGTPCGSAAADECSAADTCSGAGVCLNSDVAEGEICDDCTVDDLCSGGVCVADTEVAVLRRAKVGTFGQLNDDLAVHDPAGTAVFAVGAFAADGTAVTAGRVRLGRASSISDARTSLVVGRGEIRGTQSAFPVLQDFGTRYPDPAIACGGTDVAVASDSTADLAPASYGAVSVGDRGVLRLAAGAYTFCSLTAYNEAQILVTIGAAPTTLEIAGNLRTGFGVRIAAEGAIPPPVLRVAGASVFFRNDNDVVAHLYAPDAAVRVGRASTLHGSVVADTLVTKVAAEIACELH